MSKNFTQFTQRTDILDTDNVAGIRGTSPGAESIWLWSALKSAFLAFVNAQQTLADGPTISWNVAQGTAAKVTLAGNRIIANPTGTVDGTTYMLEIVQDTTGTRTVTWGSNFVWPGGAAPTLTSAATKRDFISFYCSNGKLYGSILGNFA